MRGTNCGREEGSADGREGRFVNFFPQFLVAILSERKARQRSRSFALGEPTAETQPKLQPALLSLLAIVSQSFTNPTLLFVFLTVRGAGCSGLAGRSPSAGPQ